MKKKKVLSHPLVFAGRMSGIMECEDLLESEKVFAKYAGKLVKDGWIREPEESRNLAHTYYTVMDWLKYKQVYRVSKALADDLFVMDDLSFPLHQLHLPYPTIYLDFRGLGMGKIAGVEPLGVYLTLADIPYGKGIVVSYCSIVTLGWNGNDYVFGGISFDFYPGHMDKTLQNTVCELTENFKEERVLIRNALLFAAYLSSAEPDITENELKKSFYRPSQKQKESSVREWDVGIRYMKEQEKHKGNLESYKGGTHRSPRPHIRRAHWHIYHVGPGRKETKVLWIAPISVGAKEKAPVVVRIPDIMDVTRKKKE